MPASRFIMRSDGWETVCHDAVLADGFFGRARGLLGRSSIEPGQGMLLVPTASIHTAFMRFPIDVVFLDINNTVLSVQAEVRPWRTASHRGAHMTLELAPGEIKRLAIKPGDHLIVLSEDRNAAARRSDQAAPMSSVPEVLLVSADRRFRAVVASLLERRGWTVQTSDVPEHVLDAVETGTPDVIVLDTGRSAVPSLTVARLRAAKRPIGVVLVGDDPTQTSGLDVLPRWGAFDDLVAAITNARVERPATAVTRSA
jgi:uncharacterized membrane protein (UPF0127 family)